MSLCRSSAIVKSILFLFISFSLCTEAFADYYRVTASKGLNVRASANKNSEVLGQLPQGDVVDVISIENGWANINYNGWQGYVSVSYLTAVTSEGKATSSSSKCLKKRAYSGSVFARSETAGAAAAAGLSADMKTAPAASPADPPKRLRRERDFSDIEHLI